MFVVTCNVGEFSNSDWDVVGIADTLSLALNLAWKHLQQSTEIDWDYIVQEVNCNELMDQCSVSFTYCGYASGQLPLLRNDGDFGEFEDFGDFGGMQTKTPPRFMMRLARILAFCLSAACVACQPFTIGIQGVLGPKYNDTFATYLSNTTPYQFQTLVYDNDVAMLADAHAGKLNMTFAGPVQYLCLSLAATTSDGVAELVSSSAVDQAPVERLSGAIVTRLNSTIQTIQDLKGKVVLCGPIASLASFAAQWQQVQVNNISLFGDTAGVFLQQNITQILPDLLGGIGDVAFVPSNYIQSYYPNQTLFKVINQVTNASFPYNHSTPLFPNAVLSALDSTPFNVRRAVAQALFEIQPTFAVAAEAMYYGFTPLGAYTQVRTLMASIGLLNNNTQCRTIEGLVDLVLCPPGTSKESNLLATCASRGITCPAGYQCVCSVCTAIPVKHSILGMSSATFAAVITVVIVLAVLVSFFVLRACWIFGRPDPYTELNLTKAIVIGESSSGNVFAADWRGQRVAVKRMFPPSSCVQSVFDKEGQTQCFSVRYICLRLLNLLARSCWINNANSRKIARIRQRMQLHHGSLMPIVSYSRGKHGLEAIAMMPYMPKGTLSDLLASRNCTVDVGAVALDVVNALLFLKNCKPQVVGINLKPHHLFLDDSLRTLIGASFRPLNMKSVWSPPECLRGESPWTSQADVYAFSMLLFTLVHKQLPFEGRKSSELLMAIKDADEETLYDARPHLKGDSPFHQLISACWAQTPEERPTLENIRLRLLTIVKASNTRPDRKYLRGMFPEHVRALLEKNQAVPTDHYPCITIFFSDICGFTEASSVLEPAALKEMLNELYSFMDRTANDLGVHKLETAGDALLAVTNVMQRQDDHAPRMAEFALRVMAGVKHIPLNPHQRDGPSVQLRVGLHSGSVVGGIAGINNVRYCLYGHAMNIASRMESTGEPGRIQLTQKTASLIAPTHPSLADRIVPRAGMTMVKGQQPMKTMWLMTDDDYKERRMSDPPRLADILVG